MAWSLFIACLVRVVVPGLAAYSHAMYIEMRHGILSRSNRCPTVCHEGLLRRGGIGLLSRGPGAFPRFERILLGCLGGLYVLILAAKQS